jgi:hypothetical protein
MEKSALEIFTECDECKAGTDPNCVCPSTGLYVAPPPSALPHIMIGVISIAIFTWSWLSLLIGDKLSTCGFNFNSW